MNGSEEQDGRGAAKAPMTAGREPERRKLLLDALVLEGFDAARLCDARAPWPAAGRLSEALQAGWHGSMGWMAEHAARRSHPAMLWPAARTAAVAAMNYGPEADPLAQLERTEEGLISVYARGADYHDVLKKALKRAARRFAETAGAQVKVFVDTAPLMEKPLAERAGLGWQGKHTNLVSRDFGSWLFLGVVLTDAELEPDAPAEDACGSCRACLDACPTDAFPAPYTLDARRCLSYLTIEHKGPIPRQFRAAMGNRIYGCDDCLAVCPWNKFAQDARQARLQARADNDAPLLADLALLTEEAFRARFAGSPIKRIGRDRFVRNVAIALGNAAPSSDGSAGRARIMAAIEALLVDPSPLVRGAAAWAFARQAAPADFEAYRAAALTAEPDEQVRAEWLAGADPGGRS